MNVQMTPCDWWNLVNDEDACEDCPFQCDLEHMTEPCKRGSVIAELNEKIKKL